MADIIGIICALILVILIVFILISISEVRRLVIKEYEVGDSLLPSAFDGFKLAVLADLHNAIKNGRDKKILESVKEINPDVIVLAGDMVVCTRASADDNLKTVGFLGELSKLAPCYYGYGNHETGLSEAVRGVSPDFFNRYMGLVKKHGDITVLDNQSVRISRGGDSVLLAGYNMDMSYYKRLIKKPLSVSDMNGVLDRGGDYLILIAHNPDYFETYVRWGANIVFAGHNHGGLVRLPYLGGIISPKLRIFPKYDYGEFKKDGCTMLVSGGMGAHSIKLRVNNVPEILSVTLKKKS